MPTLQYLNNLQVERDYLQTSEASNQNNNLIHELQHKNQAVKD